MNRICCTCLAGERDTGGAVEAGMVPAQHAVAGLKRCAHHTDFVESGVPLAADNKRLSVQSERKEKSITSHKQPSIIVYW